MTEAYSSEKDRINGKEGSEKVGQESQSLRPAQLEAGAISTETSFCTWALPQPTWGLLMAPAASVEGHPGCIGAPQPLRPFLGVCTVLPPPERLTWDLLCGLLPRLVGAAPALGQKSRRTTVENESHLFQWGSHPLLTWAHLLPPVICLVTAHTATPGNGPH